MEQLTPLAAFNALSFCFQNHENIAYAQGHASFTSLVMSTSGS